jgi:hypothetical protein
LRRRGWVVLRHARAFRSASAVPLMIRGNVGNATPTSRDGVRWWSKAVRTLPRHNPPRPRSLQVRAAARRLASVRRAAPTWWSRSHGGAKSCGRDL